MVRQYAVIFVNNQRHLIRRRISMTKIYNEVVIDMNPESSTYGDTLYEDYENYNGPMMLLNTAVPVVNTFQLGKIDLSGVSGGGQGGGGNY